MAFAPNGDLLVAETSQGQIAVISRASSPHAQPEIFASGLSLPHGLAFYKGNLYVATWSRVLEYAYPSATPVTLLSNLPQGGDHNRSALAKDGTLHVSSGSDCDVCDGSGLGGGEPARQHRSDASSHRQLAPDELDLVSANDRFGWPQCYPNPDAANRLPSPEYPAASCGGQTPAALTFQAHADRR